MASISVVLLGLNPDTRLKPVVQYLEARGVPDASVPDLVLKHPRIFEYKVSEDGKVLAKHAARIQVKFELASYHCLYHTSNLKVLLLSM